MRLIVKTQVLAILVSILWLFYVHIVAYFDQPERALEYINFFVYGLAALVGIVYFLLAKYFIGRNWMALLLVVIPFLLIYQPLVLQVSLRFMKDGNGDVVNFISLSTGTVHLLALIIGLASAVLFSKPAVK
ncbi:hypothetical protein QE429_003056 [Bacillus sp. SORGH_AS 510]|uniref:hypothetical protein n=1 Tax=Bacillus sp. SORGH_AS_0510 TaxID=3041771 RepID=UPI002780D4A6|nr:hypothetical protein [Bacillus sp. SORGH_AS_0510]MDQ1146229.1 hypothetical protein [Bacillus sp. SORGH_AS_0510]